MISVMNHLLVLILIVIIQYYCLYVSQREIPESKELTLKIAVKIVMVLTVVIFPFIIHFICHSLVLSVIGWLFYIFPYRHGLMGPFCFDGDRSVPGRT